MANLLLLGAAKGHRGALSPHCSFPVGAAMAAEELEQLPRDAELPAAEEHVRFDGEDRLKADFVRKVSEALDDGDNGRVYDLVAPLHPADIAALFELIPSERRPAFAKAITDLMGSEVIAELNAHVREQLVESLPHETVAEIAEQLDTDDAVAMIA